MTSYFHCDVTLPQAQHSHVMVRFVQATFTVHFQLKDFEFITKLKEQLSNFEFVKRSIESSLSVCSML